MSLKSLRKLRGFTQEDVAGKLCITRAAYTNIENGKRQLDAATIIKLAGILDASADAILGLPEQKRVPNTTLNGNEYEVICMYRKLPPNERDVFYKMLEGLNNSLNEKKEEQSASAM